MFSKMKIKTSTADFSEEISRLTDAFDKARTVIIGAGAGLSTSAGFTYSGGRFEKYFSDFSEKYHFTDMYTGGFYPFETSEEYWAYWSRYIYINRYLNEGNGLYERIFELVSGKDYFVLTTNVDHKFQQAGFDKKRLFYTQGDYGLFQCSEPCCNETFDNEEIILRMYREQENMRIPSGLIPKCPKCGKPVTMNLRADGTFVQDEGWYAAAERYENFLRTRGNGHVLFLELGVGYNTPGIIKFPFWRMTAKNPDSVYACINFGDAAAPREIEGRSICINKDIGECINRLLDGRGGRVST